MSPLKYVDRSRVQFDRSLMRAEVEELALDSGLKTIQCSSPVEPRAWDLLNEYLFLRRPDIELRIFGFYSSVCDLSFLHGVTNVRRFSADCLRDAVGIEHIACLANLEELSVGIFNLESFDFLKSVPPGTTSISLAATKSTKPRLDALVRFHALQKIYLEGQQQGIEVLSVIPTLEQVTLRSISTENLSYIASLPRLWSLDVKLGGIRDFSPIVGKESIKYLALWQIRGLSDLSFVSSLTGLQYLFLQSLRNVTKVPDLSNLSRLRRLHLENMKGLKDVSAIAYAPALEEFSHFSAQNIAPAHYAELLKMTSLKSVRVGFGSRRKNEAFTELAIRHGKNLNAAGKLGEGFVFM